MKYVPGTLVKLIYYCNKLDTLSRTLKTYTSYLSLHIKKEGGYSPLRIFLALKCKVYTQWLSKKSMGNCFFNWHFNCKNIFGRLLRMNIRWI